MKLKINYHKGCTFLGIAYYRFKNKKLYYISILIFTYEILILNTDKNLNNNNLKLIFLINFHYKSILSKILQPIYRLNHDLKYGFKISIESIAEWQNTKMIFNIPTHLNRKDLEFLLGRIEQ